MNPLPEWLKAKLEQARNVTASFTGCNCTQYEMDAYEVARMFVDLLDGTAIRSMPGRVRIGGENGDMFDVPTERRRRLPADNELPEERTGWLFVEGDLLPDVWWQRRYDGEVFRGRWERKQPHHTGQCADDNRERWSKDYLIVVRKEWADQMMAEKYKGTP